MIDAEGHTRLYFLFNNSGITVAVSNHGARIVSLIVPNRVNQPTDVVLGFHDALSYQKRNASFFGATIGRYANCIAQSIFETQGAMFYLDQSHNDNWLHSGVNGFDRRTFNVLFADEKTIVMSIASDGGEDGLPGKLHLTVTYRLTLSKGLEILYEATADRAMPVNLTNHTFFNLNGRGSGTVMNHCLHIKSDHFIPINQNPVSTVAILPVDRSPFDFRKAMTIGSRIYDNSVQLKHGNGYNHAFVTKGNLRKVPVVRVMGEKSGIIMEVFTTEPGLHFYSGNELGGASDVPANQYGYRSGFVLETRHFPDSPNTVDFPSCVVRPGQSFRSRIMYKFLT
ncbi:MAG TPA: aldose epimerase family protein [Mucilaginibacter sp.]